MEPESAQAIRPSPSILVELSKAVMQETAETQQEITRILVAKAVTAVQEPRPHSPERPIITVVQHRVEMAVTAEPPTTATVETEETAAAAPQGKIITTAAPAVAATAEMAETQTRVTADPAVMEEAQAKPEATAVTTAAATVEMAE